MGVPSNVLDRINRLEEARKRADASRRNDDVLRARRSAVNADRVARRPILTELAVAVFGWRDDLVKSRDGQRLWSLIGAGTRVPLHADWFWDGMPIEADNRLGAHTRIFLDGPNHHFLVEEWRNGPDGSVEPYQEVLRLKSPLEMVDQLHPRLLEGLQTRLSGPEAWQGIIDELDRRLDRYPHL
jgi:hypothetical protein